MKEYQRATNFEIARQRCDQPVPRIFQLTYVWTKRLLLKLTGIERAFSEEGMETVVAE